MNDVVIFVVNRGMMCVVIMPAFVAIIARDHPAEP